VSKSFPPWGRDAATLLLGTVMVNQLIGPVLFRAALLRAGEAGKKVDADDAHVAHAPKSHRPSSQRRAPPPAPAEPTEPRPPALATSNEP